MELKNKLLNRIKTTANKAYKKAAPIVEKKIKTTVEKGKDNAICAVLEGIEIIAMGVLMLSIVTKPNDILGLGSSDNPRNIYNVYNEAHITNNYYSKGDI